MEIILEAQDQINIVVPGLFQFEENGLFEQAAIAVTNDAIVIFSDARPDSITEDKAYYSIKRRFELNESQHVVMENLHAEGELNTFKRFNIIQTDANSSFFFYFKKKDSKFADKFFAELKGRSIVNSKRGVDL